jgi:hypothetical protein
MFTAETVFQKGEKAITISDIDGIFKLIEVDVKGFVIHDFGEEETPTVFYMFELDGVLRRANINIIFKTREEALKTLATMVPEYEKNYDEEIAVAQGELDKLVNAIADARSKMGEMSELAIKETEEKIVVALEEQKNSEENLQKIKDCKNILMSSAQELLIPKTNEQ